MVTTAVTSPCSLSTLPATASTGSACNVEGSMREISPRQRSPLPVRNRLETKEEKWASLLRTARSASAVSSDSGAVNRRSAGEFISRIFPDGSVTRMGSATESMIRFKRSLSARDCASARRILR